MENVKAAAMEYGVSPQMEFLGYISCFEDKVKLLYIMGENPVVSDPDTEHVIHALEKAFVITQDLFLNETIE